jgi:hypothetical protein
LKRRNTGFSLWAIQKPGSNQFVKPSLKTAKVKTLLCFAAAYLLAMNIANAQDAKFIFKDFPNFTIDTFHIMGNPVMVKRGVISIQLQEGIKSAYWDETDAILTIQYDDKTVRLRDIKNFFYYNLSPKSATHVVRVGLDY